jgi:hypothetical protein
MPRKSAASLAVVMPSEGRPRPPEPPSELTPSQAKIWVNIAATRPPDWFVGANATLLTALVRHAATADMLAAAINQTGPDDRRYSKLLLMMTRETAAVAQLASKLRLLPQNTYRSDKALPKVASGLKPWERHGPSFEFVS